MAALTHQNVINVIKIIGLFLCYICFYLFLRLPKFQFTYFVVSAQQRYIVFGHPKMNALGFKLSLDESSDNDFIGDSGGSVLILVSLADFIFILLIDYFTSQYP